MGIIACFFCDPKSPQDGLDVVVQFSDEETQQTMHASEFFGSATLLNYFEDKNCSMELAKKAILSRVWKKKPKVDAVDEMKKLEVNEKGLRSKDLAPTTSPPPPSHQPHPAETPRVPPTADDKAERKRRYSQNKRDQRAQKKQEKKDNAAETSISVQAFEGAGDIRRSRAFCSLSTYFLFSQGCFFCQAEFMKASEKRLMVREISWSRTREKCLKRRSNQKKRSGEDQKQVFASNCFNNICFHLPPHPRQSKGESLVASSSKNQVENFSRES